MPLIVLLYHKVAADPAGAREDRNRITISLSNFREQMHRLARNFRVVCLTDLLVSERQQLPEDTLSVAISIDDGYELTLQIVEPILREYGLPATLFIPAGHVGSPVPYWWDTLNRRGCDFQESTSARLMNLRYEEVERHIQLNEVTQKIVPEDRIANWSLLESLDPSIFTFGCHGYRHHCLSALSISELRAELRMAVDTLAANQIPLIDAIAYPFGFPESVTIDQVRETVGLFFRWGFLSSRGVIDRVALGSRLLLKRYYAEDWTGEEFESRLRALTGSKVAR